MEQLICNFCQCKYDPHTPNTYTDKHYCSPECQHASMETKIEVVCSYCGMGRKKWLSQMKKSKSGLSFCNSSCSALYHNKNKKYGNRISKIEKYFQRRLAEDFPSLNILYNDKTVIGSELDIYIPDMKLAFEVNGIVHYEPIYGFDKLSKIQNNDHQKIISCYKQGIELAILDVSSIKYYKEDRMELLYQKIKDIVTMNLKRIS
jgi:hypothetical protein